MRTKISIYLLLIFAGVGIAKAQDNEHPNDTIPIQAMSAGPGHDIGLPTIIHPTPTSAVFQQRAAAPPNLSTGMVNINIPLYTLNVNGFQLPFFLNYQTAGIRPTDSPFPLGYGWAFMPGLRISRIIMGRPDDSFRYGMNIRCAYRLEGERHTNPDEVFEYLRSLLTGRPGLGYDSQYDIFSLHLPTENVRFIMHRDSTGNWTAVTIGSGVRIRPILQNNNNGGFFNGFEVTDEQGVVYLFGEDAGHRPLDTNFPPSTYLERTSIAYTAWMLREIRLPGQGNIIRFNWTPSSHGLSHCPVAYAIREMFLQIDGRCAIFGWEVHPDPVHQTTISGHPVFPIMRLTRVEFSSGKIEIEYSGNIMRNMRVYSKNNNNYTNVKKIVFNVHSSSLLLESVQVGANKYRFEYERLQRSSNHNPQNARDWWGFYNGAGNVNAVPWFVFRGAHNVGSANREVNVSAMQRNILRKIIYPTGGFSRYYYEVHRFDYPQRAAFREGGGLRVRRIVTQESADALKITKTFYYGENENGFGIPTIEPILSSFYRTRIHINRGSDIWGEFCVYSCLNTIVFANSSVSKFTAFNPIVWYPMVTVRTSTGGKTIYRFLYNPDERCGYLQDVSMIDFIRRFRNLFNQGPRLTHRKVYSEYRRILEEEINYTLIKGLHFAPVVQGLNVEQRYIFSGSRDNGLFCDFCCLHFSASSHRFREFRDRSIAFRNYNIYIETHRPSIVTRRHFNPDGTYLRETTYYHYVVHSGVINGVRYGVINLDRVVTITSEGTNFTRRFLYPDSDLSMLTPAQRAATARMRQRNLLTTPIAEIQTLNGSTTTRITQFKDWGNNLLLPERIYLRQGDNADVLRIQFLGYDRFGNPVSIIKDNSERVTYFWGYNGRYPIIEVIGKTRDEIRNSLAGVNIVLYNQMASGVIGDDAMIRSFGEMLRQNLPGAFVTTFTYKPLVGVTSITDPRGITTFYEYDCFGRLITIYRMNNGAREILQTFEYHFANHPIECPGIEEPEPPCRKQIWNGRLDIRGSGFDSDGKFEIESTRSQQFNICHPVRVIMTLRVVDRHNNLCFYHVSVRNTNTNMNVFDRQLHNYGGAHGGTAIQFERQFEVNLSDIGLYEIVLRRAADPPVDFWDPSNPPDISHDVTLEFSLE